MDNQVEGRSTTATGNWLQPLVPLPSRVFPREVLANPSEHQLAALWNGLVMGTLRISSEHSDGTHHYLELVSSARAPLSPRDLSLWLPVLLGKAVKVAAANNDCASSTVCSAATHCLRRLGLERTSRQAPMVLVMMAHAGECRAASPSFATEGLPSSVVVRVRRPDLSLCSRLSPGEADVLRLHIDGLSHRAIATARSTSPRTIANQLASAYGKLGVSGRPELLAFLVRSELRTSLEPTQ